jgi:two-component system chemotaxis response regulator CheB
MPATASNENPSTGTHVGPARIILIASSAGGIVALRTVLSQLPADLDAAVLIVQHRTASPRTGLEQVLARSTSLRVRAMERGQSLERGSVYVAPPDLHAVITAGGVIDLHDGRRIRHVASSANPLFSSAATVYGPDVIAVVLTGMGSDGTDGVQAVRAGGGIVVAQDEATSQFFSMPRHAIETGTVTYVVPLNEIGRVLTRLVAAATEGRAETT